MEFIGVLGNSYEFLACFSTQKMALRRSSDRIHKRREGVRRARPARDQHKSDHIREKETEQQDTPTTGTRSSSTVDEKIMRTLNITIQPNTTGFLKGPARGNNILVLWITHDNDDYDDPHELDCDPMGILSNSMEWDDLEELNAKC